MFNGWALLAEIPLFVSESVAQLNALAMRVLHSLSSRRQTARDGGGWGREHSGSTVGARSGHGVTEVTDMT